MQVKLTHTLSLDEAGKKETLTKIDFSGYPVTYTITSDRGTFKEEELRSIAAREVKEQAIKSILGNSSYFIVKASAVTHCDFTVSTTDSQDEVTYEFIIRGYIIGEVACPCKDCTMRRSLKTIGVD